MLASMSDADVTLRRELLTRFIGRYGEYVKTVLVRGNVFARSGRGAELMGSDGELLWAASTDGTISTGYFPDNSADPNALQGKLMNALREEQSVMLLFRR